MSWSGCEETTWWLTWALRQEPTQRRVQAVIDSGAPASAIIEAMAADLDVVFANR